MSIQQTATKIYIGNGKERTSISGHKYISCSICMDEVDKIPPGNLARDHNDKRFMPILINPFKSGPNEYGNTHSIAVDTFKPTRRFMQEEQREPKIYLGNGKEKIRQNGDKFLICSICLDDLEKVPQKHIEMGKNGKKYLHFVAMPYKDGANQYGNTHSLSVDTFKPGKTNGDGSGGDSQATDYSEMKDVFE